MHKAAVVWCALDTTYPREGTETLLDKLPSEGTTTQLIPARGRKL